MTTQTFSSDRIPLSAGRAWFSPAYFRGELRRSWPKMLCYALYFFLILPLPLLFLINSSRHWTAAGMTDQLNSLLISGTGLYALAAAAAGVFAGMLATRYLTKRAAVDYYHSLPIRREGLLLTQYLTGLTHFAVALCANVLLTVIILLTVGDLITSVSLIASNLAAAVGYTVLSYLLFYSITVFCGLLCGTSSMQVMLTGLCLGAWPLFRALCMGYLDLAASRVNTSIYFDGGWEYTSPFIRLFMLMEIDGDGGGVISPNYTASALEYPFAPWEIALWILGSLVLLAAAMAVYRIRHVERAGTPVVFRPVTSAVKWVVVVLATMATGWLFELIGGGVFWLFFGFALGALLSFLLANTILTKNPKQMFEGWRLLILFVVLFCILSLAFGFVFAKLEENPPQNIDRIQIDLNYENYGVPYYEDPAVITAWLEMVKVQSAREATEIEDWDLPTSAADVMEYGEKYPDDETYELYLEQIPISATFEIGPLTVSYFTRNYTRAEAEPLLRAIADSAEFEAVWDSHMAAIGARQTVKDVDTGDKVSLFMGSMFEEIFYGNRDKADELLASQIGTDMPAKIVAQMPEDINYAFFQSPVYGYLNVNLHSYEIIAADGNIHDIGYRYMDLPLNMNTPALIERATGKTVDEIYLAMADGIIRNCGGLYIVHDSGRFQLTSKNSIYITDRAQIAETLRGAYRLDYPGYVRMSSPFTALEEDWGIVLPYVSPETIDGYYDGFVGGKEAIAFIRDRVPDFAVAALGD